MPLPLFAGAGAAAGGTSSAAGASAAIGAAVSEGLLSLGIALGLTATAVLASKVIDIAQDYLDESDREKKWVEGVLDRVGDKSRAEQTRLNNCKKCQWCMIVIQAQGALVGGDGKSTLSKGPYVVENRHVFTKEGIVVLGATHALLIKSLGRSALREIARMDAFARTAVYIRSRPPGGLSPGYMDYRAGASFEQNRLFRYDIGVQGTLPAFKT